MSEYPEHDKLKAIGSEITGAVQDFLDFLLGHSDIELAQYSGNTGWVDEDGDECALDDVLYPMHVNPEKLMAEHFGIDLTLMEAEKQKMLDGLGG